MQQTALLSICPGYPRLSIWRPDGVLPWKSLGELARFRTSLHVLGDLFVLSLQEQA